MTRLYTHPTTGMSHSLPTWAALYNIKLKTLAMRIARGSFTHNHKETKPMPDKFHCYECGAPWGVDHNVGNRRRRRSPHHNAYQLRRLQPMRTTQEKIAVMQAYLDGKPIECKEHCKDEYTRFPPSPEPTWNWFHFDYRVAPLTKPSIDWSSVSPQFQYLARDKSGDCYLYEKKPHLLNAEEWYTDYVAEADAFVSYKPGTCDWQDSLVPRPSLPVRLSDDFTRTFITRNGTRVTVEPRNISTWHIAEGSNGYYYGDNGHLYSTDPEHETENDIVAAI